jgi:hypothetical protein
MDQNLECLYSVAVSAVSKDFDSEREWQRRVLGRCFSERDLLREAAWVILCSGFNERVVRHRFDAISLCFCDWVSAEYIVRRAERCRSTAMAVFGSARKMAPFWTSVAMSAKRASKRFRLGFGWTRFGNFANSRLSVP